MWRETKILLIDDDSVRRRDLAVILNFLGEENLASASNDWQQAVGSLASSREVLCVLVGDVSSAGGTSSLLKTLATWDEFLPVLLLGDISSADLPEDQRRRVLSSLEMPPATANCLIRCTVPRSIARCMTRPASAVVIVNLICSAAWSAPAARFSMCAK